MKLLHSTKRRVLLALLIAMGGMGLLAQAPTHAADWSKPTLTDAYTAWPGYVKGRDEDAARMFDPATTSPTNLPANTIRWSSTNKRFEKFDGSSWNALEPLWAIGISGNAATASKWATARTLSVGGTDRSVDGTASATWSRAEIGGVPPGAVMAFAGSTCPSGWLSASGGTISRTTYADLFSYVGTTHGAGNGSTTFGLPDLRGEFVRGWDNGRGVDSGRAFGSSQLDALQNITGSLSSFVHGIGDAATVTGAFTGLADVGTSNVENGTNTRQRQYQFSFNAGLVARTAAETRARNVALLYCIKAT